MRQILLLALIAFVIMFVLDYTWIGLVADNYYRMQLGYLYAGHTLWTAALAFYVLYALGLSYFVIAPAVRVRTFKRGVLSAAFFGLVAYGTYDLTSLAITANWPVMMTFVDMAWGVVSATVTVALTYYVATKFFKAKELHPMIVIPPSSSST